ncbi:hypothetical protein FACS1894137_08190 [Spirochaetia bacterium]|nr:hypothetical protein FACS1894137_08190 [Spirochaetia bacterium]
MWLLYSSRPVDTVEQALRVVEYYKARWDIQDNILSQEKPVKEANQSAPQNDQIRENP